MITFVTLNTIITDILNLARGSKLTSAETISKKQVEFWIHQYRALLLKQDLDKGKMPNPDYIQELSSLELEDVDLVNDRSLLITGKTISRTKLHLPKTIDLNFTSGILSVTSMENQEIELIPESRVEYIKYKKYAGLEPVCYIKNNHIYIISNYAITHINIKGIFEIPTEVDTLNNDQLDSINVSINDPYPIPINLLPVLKDMILKRELNTIISTPSDNINDSQNKVESNIAK
jgi:hypothetical protein